MKYHYHKQCHCTHLLLEDEEKKLLDFIFSEAKDVNEISWRKLGSIQNRLKVKVTRNMNIPKPTIGIAVDGFCKGNPLGPAGYRGIDLETGEILFQSQLGPATNNIAEFMAIVHGLMFCKKHKKHDRVFSDSEIAIKWIERKECKTDMQKGINVELDEKIQHCLRWLVGEKKLPDVDKWFTNAWGEIPADFGNKK